MDESSIINRAFYQLAAGLPNAIGLVAAERIFYRALTVHLLAQSQFIDARLATITSAEELFGVGSAQALRTAEAFDSVEIFAAPSTTPPPSIPVVAAADSYLSVDPTTLGTHRLIARAIDNLGASADSTPVLVQVQANRPSLTLSALPSAQVRIAVTGGDGTYDLQRSSDLKTWTKVTSLTANPTATLDQPATSAGSYYRLLRP